MDQIFQEYLNYKLLHTLNTFHIILFCIKKQISEIIKIHSKYNVELEHFSV